MAENRQADPATQVTVDEMILDYLVYMAVKAVLQDRKAERSRTQPLPQQSRADLHLEMVDGKVGSIEYKSRSRLTLCAAFLLVFKANHPTYQAQLGMRFRLRLLQHTTLSMRRISAWPTTPTLPSLKEIRCQNQERASVWLSHRHSSLTSLPPTSLALQIYDTALPLPKTTLLRNRTYISQVLGAPHTPTPFYGLARCPSLLDNLPGFMAVSAAQVAMINSSTVTKRWMSLAARYMMQSALEQYLVYGERGSEKLLQAFAWGFDAYLVADEGSDEWETNAVFWDDDAEVEGWEEIRSAHLEAVG